MLNEIVLSAFVLLLPILAGCMPVGARNSSATAGAPTIERAITADQANGWVQAADYRADDVLLQWESRAPFGEGDTERCQRLIITGNHQAQYGKCSDKLQTAQLTAPNLDDMLDHLAPFEYHSVDTTLIFRGHGHVAGEVWQRAIATWAWFTFGEMYSHHICASCRTTFAWSLGPIPKRTGICGMLVVLNYGYAYKEEMPCEGHEAQVTAEGWLTTEEWTQLENWVTDRSSVYANDNSSYMNGNGSKQMSQQEIRALDEWARMVYDRLQ